MSPAILQILITIIGSGAFFSFLQFLIQRKDNREDKLDELYNKIEDGLEIQSNTSQERYTELQKDIRDGLKTQQTWGFKHYHEHADTIKKLNDAIIKLTENDTQMKNYMELIGESLLGLSHNRIINISDKCLERGGITLKEKATLESIYEPYQKLGGNGYCAAAMEQIEKLPVFSEEKAKELDKEKN